MRSRPYSTFSILRSSFALLATFTLFTTAPRAPAQTGWGSALSFDGVDDYVQAGAVPLANSSFTLEAWARRHSANPSGMDFILGQGGGGSSRSLHFGFHYGSSFVLGFYDDDLWSASGYTNTDWHHWAATYNTTNKLRCIYQDGVLIATNTATTNYQGSGPVTIGSVPWATGGEFDGEIDDVRIWNVARSQGEIAATMSAPLAGTEPNLLAYWKFDEGAGTATADATANGFDGVLVNGPSWTSSAVPVPQAPAGWGTALSMDGTDDYVGTTIPALASNYTVSAWVYLRATGNYYGIRQGVLSATSCNVSTELLIHNLPDSSAPQYLWLGRCGAYDGTNSTTTVPTNQWVHLAVTVSSNKQVNYFINGSPAGAWNGSALNLTIGPNITLGDNTSRRFNGMLDEVRIWNRARTQAEIGADATHPLTGVEPGLVAYYRFDEGGGVAAYDATPNHRNGTLNNRPVRVPATVPPPPIMTLFGANPMTNEYHVPFVDPGATAGAGPVGLAANIYNMALNADGSIVGWGENDSGYFNIPPRATNGVVAIAAGSLHSLALKADGSVVAWGLNWYDETNVPASATNGVVAVAAGSFFSLALKTNGSVVGWGNNGDGQTTIPAGAASGVVAIAAGDYHCLALKANGSVVAWGANGSGQATVPAGAMSGVVAIAGGQTHSLALKADGSVIGWGYNQYGQTTIPASAMSGVVAIAACGHHSLALKADGSVVAWGGNWYGESTVPASAGSGVVAIAAGGNWNLALKADGSVVAWGMNEQSINAAPAIARTLCPNITTTGTVTVDVPGSYLLTYHVTNALGIVGTASRTVVVVPDSTPPTLPAQVVLNLAPGDCQALLGAIPATDTSDPAPVVTCVPPLGSLLPLGRTNLLCTATDASGNSRTGAVQVLVLRSGQRLAPVGEIWTARQAGYGPIRVASSADGARLAAAESGGPIYTSTDAGLTWTPRATNRYWRALSSSADGTRLVAADGGPWDGSQFLGGRIYTSTDSGTNWTATSAPTTNWSCVAASPDGATLLAAAAGTWSGSNYSGGIYASTDSGTNWALTGARSGNWLGVAMSADGARLIACGPGLYTSSDAGQTWTPHWLSPGTFDAVASSADGATLVSVGEEWSIYTSTNSGANWTLRSDAGGWVAVAASADGTRLAAAHHSGPIYISPDSGLTWTACTSNQWWTSLASTMDGTSLLAGTFDGQIFASVPTVVPPPPPLTFVGATDRVVDLAGPGGTVVTFSVTATNDCQPSVPVTCTPPSGTIFPAGTNGVTCVAVDAYGVTHTATFTVAVRGLEPPTDLSLSNSTLPENQPPGTTIGTLSATDPEPGDRHSFALVRGAGDADNDAFTIAGHSLQTAAILNYESKQAYSIRVQAADSGDLTAEKALTITVTDVNDAPVLNMAEAPALDSVRIGAGAPAGAVGTPVTKLADIGGPLSNVTDDDPGAVTGVAITGAEQDNGTWYYSLDGGTNWNPLGVPSESSARLLSASGSRVYFQPHTNFVGTVPGALTFRAWDQTAGGNGGTADTSSNGWTTAFSAAVDSADQAVSWGWAVRLDGANDYVALPPGTWFSNDLTIEAWVHVRSYNSFSRVADFGNGEYADNVILALSSGTTGKPYFEVDKAGISYVLVAPVAVPTNRWVHLAATLQGSNARIYINGAVVATSTTIPQPNPVTRTRNYIGRSNWAANSYAAAAYDEVRLWNVACSQAQLTNNFLTTLSGNEPGLVAYYRFDEGTGLTAYDATTNHADGLLQNGPVWVRSTVPVSLTPVETVVGNTRYIQGYWPGGVTRNATPAVPNLVVGGLSENIQPSSGTPGVKLGAQGANGANGGSSYAVGGNGSAGSSGGTVKVTFDGGDFGVSTVGPNAHGVVAQGFGGNGGSGGDGWGVITGAGIGGRGATGGAGGTVTVNSSGDLATSGGNAHGILALSQAGSGGNGGDGTIWAGIGVSYGGHAGRGGSGGAVLVTGSGQITNTSHNSDGVLALSQGGRGGAGGSGSSIGSGGNGGAGGTGGDVLVSGSWAITTQGTNAPGISANSLGGTGGRSGSGGWIAGGAGTGGASGDGGAARVDFGPGAGGEGGTIATLGKDSHGIFAQSVGGFAGGGAGGGSIFYSSGGDGGSAGKGGVASIANRGLVTTHGQGAHALFAESVGGGGGSSGSGSGLFGGGAGDSKAGGDGGVVAVSNSGEARTYGFNARGIFAQSVGGSGGNAGYTVGLFTSIGGSGGLGGAGNTVNVDNTGLVETTGSDSSAIFAQSTGGGGGTGGGSTAAGLFGSLAVGGSGGGGGKGGYVTLKSGTNSITTSGTNSHGIFAQSVGGGGGKGGYGIAGSVGLGGSQSIGVGGTGGGGGSGSKVAVTSGSAITTFGTNSHGIFAQSVGGGGGEGGFTVGLSASDTYAGSVNIGGKGGKGGGADSVTVTNAGLINTEGERSYGILGQSVGGGGGEGGFSIAASGSGAVSLPVSMGGKGGDGGQGGTVTMDNRNSVTTRGLGAHGLFAQSVGGGGGSGGFSGSASGSGSFAGAFSMGGSGGKGGKGDLVNVTSTGDINTSGQRAYGILAQSVGGGGGDGGFSIAAAGSGSAALAASLGGTGGDGGNGSAVTVDSTSRITTEEQDAHGIFAQSVGGGGGSGGFSIAASGAGSYGGSLSFGGSGATGGASGSVTVRSGGQIDTAGDRSYGILAQSVGGGGGDGGFSLAGAFSGSGAAALSFGGTGAAGGSGGNVSIASQTRITTMGKDAHGVFAQSVGGGGGSGGFSVSASVSGGTTVAASFGGLGGVGAGAGNVSVATSNNIGTAGEHAYGILAQSVGGGGGDGGFSVAGGIGSGTTVSLSMGGKGGAGGVAGAVDVNTASSIATGGTNAHGIFAQSVGGGGGSGGFSVAAGISAGTAVSASLGGGGGSGANASKVNVTSTGTSIHTEGEHSYGLLAQSIGGGGGDGGFSVAGGIAKGKSVNLSMGGAGGVAGAGAGVTVTNRTAITTEGKDAHGIFVQSVGGGGGSGGFSVAGGVSSDAAIAASIGGLGNNGGSGGSVLLTNNGAISTAGTHAYGILAQSVGGGGGDGGFSVAGGISKGTSVGLSMGGKGGPGGASGTVAVNTTNRITTTGSDAHAIFAQSVGGGGGSGGFSVAGGISAEGTAISASIGGFGGTGASGSNVTVNSASTIATTGNHAYGILAQSVGGGGGDGGFSVAGSIAKGAAIGLSLGGFGAGGGQGGGVAVNSSGDILTAGELAYGVFAQSVGGGGGSGGFSVAGSVTTESSGVGLSLGGFGGTGVDGGKVEVRSSGNIETTNKGSHAIVAQSIGGGGGAGGFAGTLAGGLGDKANIAAAIGGKGGTGGSASNVMVLNSGAIRTRADASYGVFAQSVGGGGGDGGFGLAAALGTKEKAVGLAVAIGGSGGSGGKGAGVDVDNRNQIDTSGEKSHGILAQSIGGGGGNGGFSATGALSTSTNAAQLAVSIGGGGGDGNVAGAVTVSNSARITTLGKEALGIEAQSIGGGGGNGGLSFAGTFAGAEAKSLSVAIGGGAGSGNAGGAVKVDNAGVIDTTGESAHGILAQSIGGGGGIGGMSISSNRTGSANLAFTLGGGGGSGGIGGTVNVLNRSNIVTRGASANGIFAQSVGGGGGAGGSSYLGAQGRDEGGSKLSLNLALGGKGGSGNTGGLVTVANTGSIETTNQRSHGILAQSVGGGGGRGGDSSASGSGSTNLSLTLALGGDGGTNSGGGNVIVTNAGQITTRASDSHGILAQSVGGGGGEGGSSSTSSEAGEESSDKSLSVSLSLGGKGGSGNVGGAVAVNNRGGIDTFGSASHGVLAQSIGAGGGTGGSSVSSGKNSTNSSVSLTLGGSGGSGGEGGAVGVTNTGRITTRGADAYGVLAQSVGGGGGAGGASSGTTESGTDGATPLLSVNLALGGSGGAGNKGGAVKVENAGVIDTTGASAHGILAQSIGGGGGIGGMSGSTNSTGQIGVALTLGGNGGDGGVGGTVNVLNRSNIVTRGVSANGIFAQSVGGGGGAGGSSAASGKTSADSFSLSLNLTLGGKAGSGNTGGLVTVANTGSIETTNQRSHGIQAQSVGGGGGRGGDSTASSSGSTNLSLNLALGGDGGTNSGGGNVIVTNTGQITTRASDSHGIFAQSVGGGGGEGGSSSTGSEVSDDTPGQSLSLGLSLGGKGGVGNTGGTVAVNNSGAIDTFGSGSHGILAQSIGAGGGVGGSSGSSANNSVNSSITLALGGSGGSGGEGGAVGVANSGRITTRGADAYGILAQSVGGGGGAGGSTSATTEGGVSDAGSLSLNLSLGGSGGSGNKGGAVKVDTSGGIETSGDGSHGILAQSVGAGGGIGGSRRPSANHFTGLSLDLALGGKGGAAGDGGNVAVGNEGDITTRGTDAHGIIAQSVGGGGGLGGDAKSPENSSGNLSLNLALGGQGGASGHGGVVGVTNMGNVATSGEDSHGIFAQSVGGGGGSGGNASNADAQSFKNLSVVVGGQAGSSGDGGAVLIDNSGTLTTSAGGSFGILAQSVGGGGGAGGQGAMGLLGIVGIGGGGGAAGDGATVAVTQRGDINTFGAAAQGIFAQSVGGGGGMAGNVSRGLPDLLNVGIGLAFGRDGGSAGDGGSVKLASDGDITTRGTGANGIFAQSVGGGGGLAGGVGLGIGFAGSVGGAGDGGAVSVAHTGNITTLGTAAHGIFAQSAGGRGGFGGAVDITLTGNVTAQGADSVGIFAQSIGLQGGSNIFINVLNGTVQGGSGSGVGVRIDGGATNTLINHGTITTASGSAGTAIATGADNAASKALLRIYRVRVESSGTNIVRPQMWISRGAAGHMVVRFTCVTNQSYAIEYSSDLRSGAWTTVPSPTFSFPSAGMAQWVDDGTSSSGSETIHNYGTIIGSVDLGAGRNAFNNYLGATLNLGSMGLLDLGAGNVLTNFGLVTGSGQVVGDVFNGGMLSSGNSVGGLIIDGSLNLLAGASLTFDLGGRQQGSTYDFIRATNFVSFLGTLSLSLDNSFRPTAADTFTLMEFGSGSGLFDNVLNGGRLLTLDNLASFQVSYNANSLQVSGFQSPDSDGDGMNDYDESLAGTDWLDSRSVLRITSLTRNAAGQRVIRFPRVAGKNYTIEYAHDLHGGAWKELWCPAFTFPDTNTCQWIDDGTETGGLSGHNCFYRVKVQLAWPAEVGLRASIRRNASGHITLQFSGVSGNRYAVEYTTNLTSGAWTTVPSPGFTFPAAGVGQWVDDGTKTGGLGGSARFYRVKLLWSNTGNTPPRTWIRRNASGQPVLLFAGLPGNGHVVEYTANLQSGTWTPVASAVFTFPAPGLCQWIDDGTLTGGLGGETRFYRVRQQSE